MRHFVLVKILLKSDKKRQGLAQYDKSEKL